MRLPITFLFQWLNIPEYLELHQSKKEANVQTFTKFWWERILPRILETGCRFFDFYSVYTEAQKHCSISASMQEAGPNLPVHNNWVTEFNTHLIMRLAAGDGTGTHALLLITRCCVSFVFFDQGKRMNPQPHDPAAELSWSLNFLSQAFSCHPNLKSGHFLHNAIQKQVFIVMQVKRKQSLKSLRCAYTHFSGLIPDKSETKHLQQDERWHHSAKCSSSKLHMKVITTRSP